MAKEEAIKVKRRCPDRGYRKGGVRMNRTDIEYLDYTWNPTTGCSPRGDGCDNCWAKRMATRLKGRYGYPEDEPFRPTFHANRIHEPLDVKKPSRIGVSFMGDLFHGQITNVMVACVMAIIREASWHTFIVFTKRPARMREFFEYAPDEITALPNLHLYGSAWDQRSLDYTVDNIHTIRAPVKGVSLEPLLGPVSFNRLPFARGWIDHVIVGGESGPGARPIHPDWVRNVLKESDDAGVPAYFKQWGEWAPSDRPFEGIKHHEWHCGYMDAPKPRYSLRVGKKAAGNLIDGRTWEELP